MAKKKEEIEHIGTPLSTIITNEKKLKQFEKRDIVTIEELLQFYPRKYEDHRFPATPLDVQDKDVCTMILKIEDIRNRATSVVANCVERKTGITVDVVWFNMGFMYEKIVNLYGMTVLVSGRFSDGQWGKQFVNPTVFTTDIENGLSIVPVYKNIKGMSFDYLTECIQKAIQEYKEPDYVTEEIRQQFQIIAREDLYPSIHQPKDENDIEEAKKRIIFDDLYTFAEIMEKRTENVQQFSSFIPYSLKNCNHLIREQLPYKLTKDQKTVVETVIAKAREGKRINALIQGDVGCGKTITAFLLMIAMSDNGYQSVLMAPTGVLAKQHYEELSEYIKPYGLTCVYLASGMKAKEKKEVLSKIKSGEASFIIGTHACIGDDVIYKNLGLTVVDEEHKFGVKQREKLKQKSNTGVHSISMSATPIPRSLAMSMYSGTVDIFTIHSMPKGRLPVKTGISNNDREIYDFMYREICKGHQCYVVCPLITSEETQSVDNEDKELPISVEKAYEDMCNYFSPRGVKVACITGKAKDEEKSSIIEAFNSNQYQILIATTIIEVGVNVPNATVMTIMNADRFGLAGLHQLRGRVGRNSLQSFCILKSDDYENPRLKAMCQTTDGFKIAEVDLALRGTGDFIGTKQSGDNRYVELMMKYPKLYNSIKKIVRKEESLCFGSEE